MKRSTLMQTLLAVVAGAYRDVPVAGQREPLVVCLECEADDGHVLGCRVQAAEEELARALVAGGAALSLARGVPCA